MLRKWFTFTALLVIAAATTVANDRWISRHHARQLVLKFMQDDGYNTSASNFYLESVRDPSFPDFYIFEARVDNADRLDAAGTYVVNPQTADVQEMFTCRQPHSARLRRFQEKLRKSIGLSPSEYRKLKARTTMPCYK